MPKLKRNTISTVEVLPAIFTTPDAMFSIKREKEEIDFIPYPWQLACPNNLIECITVNVKKLQFSLNTLDFLVLQEA